MPRACTRIVNRSLNVRFSLKADKYQRVSVSPLCATTGREQMQQLWKAGLLDYFVGEREAA
jgi:hypothetical protein